MIEILKKPQHKCEVCGCVYTFDKEDFKDDKNWIKSIDYRSLYEYRTFVECPICNAKYVLKSKQVKE